MKNRKEKNFVNKKNKNNIPPKIEIEFIGQAEEEALIREEKRKRAEEEAKKNKIKNKKLINKKEKTKTKTKINKKENEEKEYEKLDFTIQGLDDEDEEIEKEELDNNIYDEIKAQNKEELKDSIIDNKKENKIINNSEKIEINKKNKIKKFKKKEENNFENILINNNKKIKKKIIIIIPCIIIVLITSLITLYFVNVPFQDYMDEYVFRKNKQSEDLISISLDASKNPTVIAYNGVLSVLEQNNLKLYNGVGKLTEEISLKISDPIYDAKNNYLIIGEKKGNKLYLVDNISVKWEKEIEGNISRVAVNKNGYSAIVITDTSYKSIIAVFDEKGKELFKIYLATTSVADISISENNKKLGIAEIDTGGTQIQSIIKIIDIEKAKNSSKDSVVYKYKAALGDLITDIEYQTKEKLLCMYDNSIHLIDVDKDEELIGLRDSEGKTNFAEITLEDAVYRVKEKSSGLFKANTVLEIINTSSKRGALYTVDGIAKNTIGKDKYIVLNLGSEVDFITDNGWLSKRYTTSKGIKDIVLSKNVAGIVYRDKLEIINL